MKLSRRRFSRYLLGAPIAAASYGALGTMLDDGRALAAEEGAGASPSSMARYLVRENRDLSRAERRIISRDVAQLEDVLKRIRDFPLENDVPPAINFRPMKSRSGKGGHR